MKLRTLKELLLYNYRYWLGYSAIVGFILYFLGWKINTYPLGISQPEMATAAGNLYFNDILQSPLYPLHALLQWTSTSLFGISAWSIRLPGLIIGLLTALVLYSLLARWFGKSTALIGTAVFISADWFLFIARLSTGAVEFSLWLSLALLCLTKLLERKSFWLIAFTASIGMLLFLPFGMVAAIALVAGLFACRILRERTAESKLVIKIICCVLAVISLGLFIYVSISNNEFLKSVLGIQNLPSITEYFRNVLNNLGGVVAVLPNSNPLISPSGILFVRFFELIFIIFGVIMFWQTRVNRLNLLVIILSIALALTSGLSAGSRGNGLMLVPAAIFMTAGVRHLLHRWKRTFPNNPYARIAAYAPLCAVFIFTVSLHYVSYFVLWQNQTASRATFSPDLQLLQSELSKEQYSGNTCYIESTDSAFNALLSASKTTCQLEFSTAESRLIDAQYFIVRNGSTFLVSTNVAETKALTSETQTDNVRWVIIKN